MIIKMPRKKESVTFTLGSAFQEEREGRASLGTGLPLRTDGMLLHCLIINFIIILHLINSALMTAVRVGFDTTGGGHFGSCKSIMSDQ